MPYSVSPRLRDHTVGPKPTMYWVTLTPNFLAGTRWPISCSAMLSATPTTTTRTPRRKSTPPLSHPFPDSRSDGLDRRRRTTDGGRWSWSGSAGDGAAGGVAGPGVGAEDVVEREVDD